MNKVFSHNANAYSRFKTREVSIGHVPLGAGNPIRIQSMTTADTMNTKATVEESIRMILAGCEYVRITAPSLKEAENLRVIKQELKAKGYNTPLIADIHFTPKAAELAATIIEKVRVNPGNYADKKKFEEIAYTDQTYQAEIDRIREKFTPLVQICKAHGTAMRIGTNHGSLSDRILSKYGDTPLGMVESAMEFLRICREQDYHDIVLSMKASNTRVMVQAYRLLVKTMMESGMNYPLHLGVTEAGEAEDGRIKSAVGIGALLADGIGDTIRVSLTEAPEDEIPVARNILKPFMGLKDAGIDAKSFENYPVNPFEYEKRETNAVLNIGGKNPPIVMADFCLKKEIKPASFFALGHTYSVPLDKWSSSDRPADYVFIGDHLLNFEVPGNLGIIQNHATWLKQKDKKHHYPFITKKEFENGAELSEQLTVLYLLAKDLSTGYVQQIRKYNNIVILIDTYEENNPIQEQRNIFGTLILNKCKNPVIIGRAYQNLEPEELLTRSSTDLGALLLDGLGEGVFIAAENCGNDQFLNHTAFGILQATRTRISKAEYISCPSCGRTLFDLQETTAKIRAVTDHLKGVKIGIMGCIVNGPGEMADADYGYVGTGKGKITLYKEKKVVKKNVPEQQAVAELIELIKEGGDWVEFSNLHKEKDN